MLICILAIIGFLFLWQWWSARAYRITSSYEQVHFTETEDGWRIGLVRFPPETGRRRYPVVMCHGLGANHTGFDLRPDNSVARMLAELGYDVWILDLRGSGYSRSSGAETNGSFSWTFDDYLTHDAPAAIEYVMAQTGCQRVHWLGHSMGGLILYGLLGLGWSDRIQSAIVSGSSLNYAGAASDFHGYKKLLWLTDLIPGLPARLLARLNAPFPGRIPLPTEKFNWWPDNMDAMDCRRLCAHTLDDIPCSLLRQLATALEASGLKSFDNSINYFDRLADATSPVLAFAADEDRQCSPEAARTTFDRLGSDDKQLVVLGLAHGQSTHYGHIDILVGKQAPVDVWPKIDSWLEAHDD